MGSRAKTGEFRSLHGDDDLYEIVGLVALQARPQRPEKLTQAQFDAESAAVAKKHKLAAPPTARAIYMRLEKSWKDIVCDAVKVADGKGSHAHTVSVGKKSDEWPDLDERHIYYALHRVARFLKVETLANLEYDAGRAALISSVSRAEANYLEAILPTAAQIERVADGDWELALALGGMRHERKQFKALPMLNLVWHYYETKKAFPTETKLRAYANTDLGIAMPKRDGPFGDYIDELRAARTERGWSTPDDGPEVGQALSTVELAVLIDGAPAYFPKGGWTEEKVLECFVAYVSEFQGIADLRLRHYQGLQPKRDWPSSNAYSKFGSYSWWLKRAKAEIASAKVEQQAA